MEDIGRERKRMPARAEHWCRDLAVGLSGPLLLGPLGRRNETTTQTHQRGIPYPKPCPLKGRGPVTFVPRFLGLEVVPLYESPSRVTRGLEKPEDLRVNIWAE